MSGHSRLFGYYSWLVLFPRSDEASRKLKRIAALVAPIMRKRGWTAGSLEEFWPDPGLLGLNYGGGLRILVRFRPAEDHTQFLPFDDIMDTMLHELCHNQVGPHNSQFHTLWNDLRYEYRDLIAKGIIGLGFDSDGNRLEGNKPDGTRLGGQSNPVCPRDRYIRAFNEQLRRYYEELVRHWFGGLYVSSGSSVFRGAPVPIPCARLAGSPAPGGTDQPLVQADRRLLCADAAERRRREVTKGCATGTAMADKIARQASKNGFRSIADQDMANERAIAQAVSEFEQEDKAIRASLKHFRSSKSHGGRSASSKASSSSSVAASAKAPSVLSTRSAASSSKRSSDTGSTASTRSSVQLSPGSERVKLFPSISSSSRSSARHSHASSKASSSSSSLSSSSQSKTSRWSCPKCTLINRPSHTHCNACGKRRPSPRSSS